MEVQEQIKLRGHLELFLRDLKGNLVDKRSIHNVVVTNGRVFVLEQIASSEIDTDRAISHLAVGTDTTAAATSDTALGSETTRKAIGTFTTSNLTSNPPSWRAEVNFATNEGNTTLGEAGLFNSSAAGTLFNHAIFTTLDKTTSNTLTVRFTVSN